MINFVYLIINFVFYSHNLNININKYLFYLLQIVKNNTEDEQRTLNSLIKCKLCSLGEKQKSGSPFMDLQTDKLNFKQTGIPGGLTLVAFLECLL